MLKFVRAIDLPYGLLSSGGEGWTYRHGIVGNLVRRGLTIAGGIALGTGCLSSKEYSHLAQNLHPAQLSIAKGHVAEWG